MNRENAIEIRDVTVNYRVYKDKSNTLKDRILNWKRNRYEERTVLQNVSFSVKKGESIGLVGSNGCGKSTTLKVLSKILYPDSGTVETSGRISSLLELGAGFHPDLTGRENIFINASVFGLSKKEIMNRMDDIISFSELSEYIDSPVRTYSSGMYMRLAFSVAINVDADILLIDEILAVGDVNFQTKCFNKLMEIKEKGVTIVLVSHSMDQIERLCDRSIWIHEGRIKGEGAPLDIHREYFDYMYSKRNGSDEKALQEEALDKTEESHGRNEKQPVEKDAVVVKNCKISDANGIEKKVFFVGDEVRFSVDAEATEKLTDYFIELNLVRADGLFCYGVSTLTDEIPREVWNDVKHIGVRFPEMDLLKGKYHFDFRVANGEGATIIFKGKIAEFEIDYHRVERGIVYLNHRWESN